jgi:hypothetical protein
MFDEKNSFIFKKKYFYYLFSKNIIILFLLILFIQIDKCKNGIEKINKINSNFSFKNNIQKCYLSLDSSNIKIIHLILTRFLMEFFSKSFSKNLYKEEYILNGIRVMKKYLFPSLENQSCKNFIWILIIGNKANITYVKNALNLNKNSFQSIVIYEKEIKNYVKKISSGFDILITTRIDYDDRIYYDAVNDVRKAVNINRPMILYGYNRGVFYFESEGKYYDYYNNWRNNGAHSIFLSLILVLNKVNDSYTVYDLNNHVTIRQTLLKNYKSYGIKTLNYEPSIFDNGDPKFVYVRQNYSSTFSFKINRKTLKINNFNLSKFYGK